MRAPGPPAATDLGALGRMLAAGEVKACCADVYQHSAVRWLLGGELHPGGVATTRRALELAELGPGKRLLDVASGAGDSALLAARELGCAVVGLEYSTAAVDAASGAARDAGLDGIVEFRRGDAEALPFTAGEFDAVLCECSLCTFPDKHRAVAEMRRVLKPGGWVVICDVVVDRRRLPSGFDGALATIACVGEALSSRGYRDVLTGAGLDVLAIESRPRDAAALAERVHDRLRGARLMGFGGVPGSSPAVEGAIELAAAARRAIAEGALGYAILAAR